MLGYLLRRVLAAIPVMGVVALVVFLLLRLTPGDPAAVLAGDNATPAQLEHIRAKMEMDDKSTVDLWADDGVYDYYDDSGVSSKKFLVRKPVATGVVTSPFGWRTHPLLHVSELHTGVDWGAPYGTPIFAAGNGDIAATWYSSTSFAINIDLTDGQTHQVALYATDLDLVADLSGPNYVPRS